MDPLSKSELMKFDIYRIISSSPEAVIRWHDGRFDRFSAQSQHAADLRTCWRKIRRELGLRKQWDGRQ